MTSAERFFVTPNADDPCPGKLTGEPCLTLTQFVSGSYTRFLSDPNRVSNITLDLQPGRHRLTSSYDLLVRNMDSFVLRAADKAVVDCDSHYFNISNIRLLHISGVTFVNCSRNIVIKSVTRFVLEECTINNLQRLWVADTKEAAIVKSSFSNSKQAVHVVKTSLSVSQSSFNNNCVGIYGENSHLSIHGSNFRENTARCDSVLRSGGAVYVKQEAVQRVRQVQLEPLAIVNCTFEENDAAESGGAVYIAGINVNINDSVFVNNTARLQGGAVFIASSSSLTRTTSTIHNTSFFSNHASIGGGAVYVPASIRISESAFVGNTAHYRGGGAVYTGGRFSNVEVTDSVFLNNSAAYCAAFDIDEFRHSVRLVGSAFSHNTATGESDIKDILSFSGIKSDIGGVICVRNATVSILDGNFTQNRASGYGGVMYVDDSTIDIERSIFDGNVAGFSGGVMFTEQHRVQLMIVNSTFIENQAQSGDGGVVYIGRADSRVNVRDSKFGLNRASNKGGVFVVFGGVLEINDTNVYYDNSAKVGGGIGSSCNSDITIPSDIFSVKDPELSSCRLLESSLDVPQDQVTTVTNAVDAMTTVSPTEIETPSASASTSSIMPTTSAEFEGDTSAPSDPKTSTSGATVGNEIAIEDTTISSPSSTSMSTSGSPTLTTAPTLDLPALYFTLNGTVLLNGSVISV